MTALVKLGKMFKSSFRSQANQTLELSIFKFHDVIKCRSKNKKYILLNNLKGKVILVMKFGQFMLYSTGNNFIKTFNKNCSLRTSSRLFLVCKQLSTTFIGKWNFWSNLPRYIIAKLSKLVQISMLASSDSFLLRIPWKFKKGLELVSWPQFLIYFLVKSFIL